MCLSVPLQARIVLSEIINKNGYLAENSGENNSGNTDKRKSKDINKNGELPSPSNKNKFSQASASFWHVAYYSFFVR